MRTLILVFWLAASAMPVFFESRASGAEDPAHEAILSGLKDALVAKRLQAIKRAVKGGMSDAPTIEALAGALKDPSPDVRRSSAAALEKLGTPAPIPAAIPTPPNAPVSTNVPAEKPAESHTRDAVPALIEAAADSDPATRAAIISALGTLGKGEPKALPALLGALKDPSPQMRVTAIEALRRFGAEPKDTQAALVQAALIEKHPDALNALAAMLAECNPVPLELLPFYVNAVKGSIGLRAKCFEALNKMGPKAIPGVLPLLKCELVLVRREAAALIEKYAKESPLIVPQLIAALSDNDVYVRKSTAAAIAAIGPDAMGALPDLIKMLSSPDMAVRMTSATVIESLGPPAKDAVPALAGLMLDKTLPCRAAAGKALAKIGAPGRDELFGLLKSPRDDIRSAASVALVNCGDSAMSGLAEILKSDSPESITAALLTLDRLGGARGPAIAPMIPLLRHKLPAVRQSSQLVLSRTGPRAVKPLIDFLVAETDAAPELRSAVTDVLGRIGKDSVSPLLEIVKTKQEGAALFSAIEALGKVGVAASDSTPLLMEMVSTVPANLNPPAPLPGAKKGVPLQPPPVPAYVKLDTTVIQALAGFGPHAGAALPVLFEMLKDGDYTVRGEAARAISKIARGNERIPPLSETLERCEAGNIAAALRVFQDAGMNALLFELDTPSAPIRQRIGTVFASLPQTATIPFLAGALKNEEPRIRSGVAQILAEFRRIPRKGAAAAALANANLLEPLLAALKNAVKDTDPDVRVLAAYAYQKAIDPDDGDCVERIATGLAQCTLENRPRGFIALDFYNLEKVGGKAASALPVLLRSMGSEYSIPPTPKTLIQRIGITKADVPVLVDALKEKIVTTRRAALQLMASLGADAADATSALIDALADEDKGGKAIGPVFMAIGQDAVPPLIEALKSTNVKTRAGVIQALTQMNLDGEWLGKIAASLSDDRPELRAAALAVLNTSFERAKFALPHVRDLLIDGDKAAYKARLELFSVLGSEITPVLVDALKDTNPQARARAAIALKPHGSVPPPPEALKPLMALLADDNLDVKAAALQTLSFYDENAAEIIPGLVETMKDESTILRRSALAYLKTHGSAAPAAAIQALALAMKDPTTKIRLMAIAAMPDLGPAAGPLLFEAIGDAEHAVRAQAAEMLETLGLANDPAKKILIEEMFALDAVEQYALAQEDHFIKSFDENRVHYYATTLSELAVLPNTLAAADAKSEAAVPYNGFLFKMLEGQGANAPGGAKKYLADGKMSQGHALIAFPAEHGKTGRFTFIVGDDGTIYKKDLGPETARLCGDMRELNPDDSWTKFKVKPKDEGPVRFHPNEAEADDDMEF